jgi:RNA polymerase sigma factor (sigma-70 family)
VENLLDTKVGEAGGLVNALSWATVISPRDTRVRRAWTDWVEPNEVADTVRRAAVGDKQAWDEIVTSFSGLVWSIATSHRLGSADAAEVVQTTWLRLLENLDRIREPERLGGWLATTARRESQRLQRLHGREVVTDDEARFDDVPATLPTPEDAMLSAERRRQLRRAFAKLPEHCRRLLHLVVVVAPPYAEVAAALDMPIGSIGPTRARCLDRLRKLLDADGGGELAMGY